MTAAERVREIRETLRLTQKQFGAEFGFEWYKIKDIEAGKQKVSSDFALQIEKRYGYNFQWILTGEGEKKKADRVAEPPVPWESLPLSAGNGKRLQYLIQEASETLADLESDQEKLHFMSEMINLIAAHKKPKK